MNAHISKRSIRKRSNIRPIGGDIGGLEHSTFPLAKPIADLIRDLFQVRGTRLEASKLLTEELDKGVRTHSDSGLVVDHVKPNIKSMLCSLDGSLVNVVKLGKLIVLIIELESLVAEAVQELQRAINAVLHDGELLRNLHDADGHLQDIVGGNDLLELTDVIVHLRDTLELLLDLEENLAVINSGDALERKGNGLEDLGEVIGLIGERREFTDVKSKVDTSLSDLRSVLTVLAEKLRIILHGTKMLCLGALNLTLQRVNLLQENSGTLTHTGVNRRVRERSINGERINVGETGNNISSIVGSNDSSSGNVVDLITINVDLGNLRDDSIVLTITINVLADGTLLVLLSKKSLDTLLLLEEFLLELLKGRGFG